MPLRTMRSSWTLLEEALLTAEAAETALAAPPLPAVVAPPHRAQFRNSHQKGAVDAGAAGYGGHLN